MVGADQAEFSACAAGTAGRALLALHAWRAIEVAGRAATTGRPSAAATQAVIASHATLL